MNKHDGTCFQVMFTDTFTDVLLQALWFIKMSKIRFLSAPGFSTARRDSRWACGHLASPADTQTHVSHGSERRSSDVCTVFTSLHSSTQKIRYESLPYLPMPWSSMGYRQDLLRYSSDKRENVTQSWYDHYTKQPNKIITIYTMEA